jgi:hypothetical protein
MIIGGIILALLAASCTAVAVLVAVTAETSTQVWIASYFGVIFFALTFGTVKCLIADIRDR